MRSLLLVWGSVLLLSNTANCQKDSSAAPTLGGSRGRAWIVPIGVVASATIDSEIREWALQTHSGSLDHVARVINPLGTAHVLVPAMAALYAGSVITHHVSAEAATLEIAAAYAASDIVESILKPMVGRERPHVDGNSRRFHAFTANGDWHSLPSAHVAHITAIAQAISMQSDSGRISALADALVALVAWDRIYEDEHWTSDVMATIAVTSAVSGATVRWIDNHLRRPRPRPATSETAASPTPQ